MAAAFQAKANGTGNFVGSVTVAHTVSAGSNLAMFVCIACGGGDRITTVKWNTSESLARVIADFSGGSSGAYIYDLAAPTATTANVVATISSNSNANVTVTSWTGVDQTTPSDANASGGSVFQNSPRSDNITVTAGGYAIDQISSSQSTLTVSGSQTLLYEGTSGGATPESGASYLADATAMAWTWVTQANISHAVAAIKPSGGGATLKLFTPSSLNGLGSGGAFFHDRLS